MELNAAGIKDAVRINWSHQVDIRLEYHIVRNNDILGIVHSGDPLEFVDSIGEPGKMYTYEVYPVVERNPEIRGVSRSVSFVFPRVAHVKSLMANAIPNGVKLSWPRPSAYTSVYKIFCNGEVMDTLESSDGFVEYEAYFGIPGTMNLYEVCPGYRRNLKYTFGKKRSIGAWQKSLLKPSNLSVYPDSRSLKISFTAFEDSFVQYSRGEFKGIEGVEFYRSWKLNVPEYLGKVDVGDNWEIVDFQGIPGDTNVYLLRSYTNRKGKKYYSPFSALSAVFPQLPAPEKIEIKSYATGHHSLSWNYYREDVNLEVLRSINGEGFIRIGNISGHLNRFSDIQSINEGNCSVCTSGCS